MPKARTKKRPFIDKKNDRTTTFALVHRSQKDPLAADSDAPQRVLHQLPESAKKRKEEEHEHGIFYDDEYDYLQHLKDRNLVEHDWEEAERFLIDKGETVGDAPKTKGNLNLPSSVFASAREEDIGLLNKAAPRSGPLIDWDPDIVETLDDDFKSHDVVLTMKDAETELCDDDAEDDLDFLIAEAAQEGDESEAEDDESDYDSEADDDVPSLEGGFSFSGEETKSKFTSYSMSSSVIRRNNQLALLDDKFEEFFDEYNDENLGGLDCEEIEGFQAETSEVMKQIINNFEKEQNSNRQNLDRTTELDLQYIRDEDEEKEVVVVDEAANKEDRWDCESILTTYSNLYNHPKLISEARKVQPIIQPGKHGIPKNVLGKGLTAHALKQLDRETRSDSDDDSDDDYETRTLASRVSAISIRNKHETLEEKKSRKQAVKQLKKERRLEKKANKTAFKEEKSRQEKIDLSLSKNIQGIKLI